MIFLWAFTWYSYWIFMKQQINVINIIGAVVSAGLFVVSHFLPVKKVSSRALKFVTSKNSENDLLMDASLDLQSNIKLQIPPETFAAQIHTSSFNQVGKSTLQATGFKAEELESESIQVADKSRELSLESNGCPKNLEYFTQKPRPKEPPEECLTCKNLLTCVCLTNN